MSQISCSQSSGLMNFDAIAEGITNEETPPGCWLSVLRGDSRSLQALSQAVQVGALKPEVPVSVHSTARLLHGNVNVQSAGVEPDAAPDSQRGRFGDLTQRQ